MKTATKTNTLQHLSAMTGTEKVDVFFSSINYYVGKALTTESEGS